MEKPVFQGFKSAYCYLPEYGWEQLEGFDEQELSQLQKIVKNKMNFITK